jgi:sterol desaturase/sphingolipid hydroxylase (fatty acid hydroxylase superfamily)
MGDMLLSLQLEAITYVGLMIVITLFAYLSRGRAALEWTPELRQSALTNFLMLHWGGLNGVFYMFTIAPLIWAYSAFNLPALPPEFWDGCPIIIKALAALLVYDIAMYWIHRMLHTGWFWPTHAVHHSDPNMHFLTWSRAHFTEQLVLLSALVLTTSWMGFSISEIVWLYIAKSLHQYYVHSRIDWDHGFLKYVIASPQIHRWHHANVEAAYDKNFATIFPFLDVIWGTYYNPGPSIDVPTGISDAPPNDFVSQLLYPFRKWGEMLKARGGAPAEAPAEARAA